MQHREISLLEDSFYEELYRHHAPALFAYAYLQTSSREEAEDIVLEVFLSILQNNRYPTFDEKKQEAWLWTITRNKVVDSYRRSLRRPQISIEWLSEALYEDDALAPEQLSLKRERGTDQAGYDRSTYSLFHGPRCLGTCHWCIGLVA
jgi:DNA-directed RNA polymerase specialized sigma24 family protein